MAPHHNNDANPKPHHGDHHLWRARALDLHTEESQEGSSRRFQKVDNLKMTITLGESDSKFKSHRNKFCRGEE